MEMNIKMLKELIKDLPDNMLVFTACQGYCNYDFKNDKPYESTDTFAIIHDGKLFITDNCAVEVDRAGNIL